MKPESTSKNQRLLATRSMIKRGSEDNP